jgi:predicted nuclease of predicted toxin-antitoxin system
VKLLIDEMYSPVIAERLREAGHDAVSVSELADVVGQDDAQVCEAAAGAGRAVVTENAADFLVLARERTAAGRVAPSLVITTNQSFPRHSQAFLGRAIRALAAFSEAHPDDDAQAGAVYWLRPVA